jgi:hypothetical protein
MVQRSHGRCEARQYLVCQSSPDPSPLFSLSLAMASTRGTSFLAATTSSAYKPISVWSLNAHTIYGEGTRAVEGGSALIPLQQNEQHIDHAHLEHNK